MMQLAGLSSPHPSSRPKMTATAMKQTAKMAGRREAPTSNLPHLMKMLWPKWVGDEAIHDVVALFRKAFHAFNGLRSFSSTSFAPRGEI
jgi:hypothetical protein